MDGLMPLSIKEKALSWLFYSSFDSVSDFKFYFELMTIPKD